MNLAGTVHSSLAAEQAEFLSGSYFVKQFRAAGASWGRPRVAQREELRNGCLRVGFQEFKGPCSMTNQQISKPTVHTRERGAELVEFAMVFPLFLLLMIGIIEFGRAYNIYENVIHATREGVRAASADCLTGGNCTPGSYSKLTPAEIRTKIRGALQRDQHLCSRQRHYHRQCDGPRRGRL